MVVDVWDTVGVFVALLVLTEAAVDLVAGSEHHGRQVAYSAANARSTDRSQRELRGTALNPGWDAAALPGPGRWPLRFGGP